MRIGTWNVAYGVGRRNADRLALLEQHDADVWVLTETHRDLDLAGSHEHSLLSEPRPGRREGSTWVTLGSRYPVLRRIEVPDPRRMVAVVLKSPVGELSVAGVVLPWHTDRGDAVANPTARNWLEH